MIFQSKSNLIIFYSQVLNQFKFQIRFEKRIGQEAEGIGGKPRSLEHEMKSLPVDEKNIM